METDNVPVIRFADGEKTAFDDSVAREFPFNIILNDHELVTLLCSPTDLKSLAVGFLFSEGFIKAKEEIKQVTIDEEHGIARVETAAGQSADVETVFKRFITSGCGRGASFYSAVDVTGDMQVKSETSIRVAEVFGLVAIFQHRSELYRATGGVHSAALCEGNKILVFSEDIGRHNAIDKVFGNCLLNDIPTIGRVVLTSGRISSEILLKVAKRGVPVVISRSAPTDLGVKLARKLGVTLLGFARGKRVNVYSHDWRIAHDAD